MIERPVADARHLHQCGHDAIAVDRVQSVVVKRGLGCRFFRASVVAPPQCKVCLRTRDRIWRIRVGEASGLVRNDGICGAVDDHQGPRGGHGSRKARDRGDQVTGLGQHTLRHEAAVGVAGKIDTGDVDGVRVRHLRHHRPQEAHVVHIVRHICCVRVNKAASVSLALEHTVLAEAFIAPSGIPPGPSGEPILTDRLVLGLRPCHDEPKLFGLYEPARVGELGRCTIVHAVQVDHERHSSLRGSDRCGHIGVPRARDAVMGDGGGVEQLGFRCDRCERAPPGRAGARAKDQ
eukprot:scaffold53786_cov62-Phaeocystis_antarctica.AAC.1